MWKWRSDSVVKEIKARSPPPAQQVGLAMWRGWWWDHLDIRGRPREINETEISDGTFLNYSLFRFRWQRQRGWVGQCGEGGDEAARTLAMSRGRLKQRHLMEHFWTILCLDSDDSDNEGGLGNVERVVMRPPGHSGKAKKGHLCFDAIFETGN